MCVYVLRICILRRNFIFVHRVCYTDLSIPRHTWIVHVRAFSTGHSFKHCVFSVYVYVCKCKYFTLLRRVWAPSRVYVGRRHRKISYTKKKNNKMKRKERKITFQCYIIDFWIKRRIESFTNCTLTYIFTHIYKNHLLLLTFTASRYSFNIKKEPLTVFKKKLGFFLSFL